MMRTPAVRLALSIVLIASAAAVSLSPLNAEYAPAAWGAVALGAVLGLAFEWRQRRGTSRGASTARPKIWLNATGITLDLAILSQIAAATTQALAAISLPSPHLPLHNTPGIGALYLFLAGVTALGAVWLALNQGDKGRCGAALLGAGLFSSTLYLRSFAVAEAGPIYAPIFALALIAALTFQASKSQVASPKSQVARFTFHPYGSRITQYALRITQYASRFTLWSFVFLAAVALAVLFSPVPGQSLDYWLRLAALIGLAMLLSHSIDTARAWQIAAWGIVLIAGAAPVLLALGKLLSLIASFGPLAALAYRLHPTELGGANLIARSVLCVIPLALALTNTLSPRVQWGLKGGILIGSAFVMLYSQSWEGLYAWPLACGAYGLLARWNDIQKIWRRWADFAKWGVAAGVTLLAFILVAVSARLSPMLNIYSSNGRLIHWRGAALAWSHHPWVGGGPGNETIYTPYASQVGLLANTQVTLDDPLSVIVVNAGRSLTAHSHNLFLEIGAGTGVLGCIAFVGLLVSLFSLGLRAWRSGEGALRLWIAACLAGILGELAWGMLDVLWVTPPFFSFPIWGLVGLLLAANRVRGTSDETIQYPISKVKLEIGDLKWVIWNGSLVVLSILIVLLPSLASAHTAAGFLALQEQRWQDAVSSLEQAARYAPLNSHIQELLAQSYLGQGDTQRAESAYERAGVLKRGYSPYAAQLAWFAWLRGDDDLAAHHLQQAINTDPGQAWRDGLRADLGLIEVARWSKGAKSDLKETVQLFKEAIELDPRMALAPYWAPAQGPDAAFSSRGENKPGFDVVLDPVYLHGPSLELNKRIQSHLGAANMTPRQFSFENLPSPISLNDVLDAIDADYQAARANNNRQAPLLLAALAQAARNAGLADRAEQAYIEFQALEPDSAYGFRDLGTLYREQGRLQEAQKMLERAVLVSPRDVDSRYNLALVYLDREMWAEAGQALDVITRQSLATLFNSRLYDPDLYTAQARLDQAQGRPDQAIDALRKATLIRGLPADHLALTDLERQQGQSQEAMGQCLKAADALLRTWPRPMTPQLWEIGVCLAQSDFGFRISDFRLGGSVVQAVLQGHVYRARGQLDQAVLAYRRAADASPGEGAPHYFLGETYQALGQSESAEAEYRQAARLDPLESLPLLALGRMQWGQGKKEAAIESLRAAVEATPGWDEAHMALGNALLANGDRQGAARHLQQARLLDGGVYEGVYFDFGEQLASAAIESPGPEYVRGDYFTIDGKKERVLFMHPDSRAQYTVTVPAGATLAFDVAMSPASWDQPGDGVAFAVNVESDGNTKQLFSTYIDPKRNPADRRWHPYSIDLSAYAGQTVTLIFETGSGPAGDYGYDWAGWGEPRLLRP